MRVGFMGSPDFSLGTLESLLKVGFDVPVVYTQPPRAKGRKRVVTPCAVHAFANSMGITALSPTSFNDANTIQRLQSYALDALAVVAYGIILPQTVLDIPQFGCFNGHASLLPRWRGAAPIARAIEAGDTKTGVCIMKMQAGLDTGDILRVDTVDIDPAMTAKHLHSTLARLTGLAMVESLQQVQKGTAAFTPQSSQGVCYAPKLFKGEGRIDWSLSSADIHNKVRAFTPFPSTYTTFGAVTVKILSVESTNCTHRQAVGSVLQCSPLTIACGKGTLIIKTLQKSGKNPMSAAEFLNGFPLRVGDILGEQA